MRTIPTPVHCVLPLFLQLVLFFVAPTTVAAVPLSPSPTISSDVIAVSGTTTSASYTSTDTSLPTSSTKIKEITAAVAFTSEKITYPWQSDAKSAVRRILNLALEACSETGHSEGSGGKPKNKLDISWGKLYAAAPPEFTFKVQVQNWPGRTGPKWLWGLKSSEFSGTLRLVPSGSENDDVPLLSLPPPAFVKAGKYSGAETGESSNTESSGKGREKGLTSSRPAAVTRKKGDLETVKESDESDVKGKGKGKATE
ncbi:hypothetical protein GGU11DRAFT_754564 [Lentinula aff. detonsa]|nr:hypothetical protein GGU11DRAFT_754564 [Lentinula aff. detonsa]